MPALLVLVLIFIILLIFVSCIRIVPQAQAMSHKSEHIDDL